MYLYIYTTYSILQYYVTMTATLGFHKAVAESALKRIAAENSKAWHRRKTNTLSAVLRLVTG